MPMPKVQLQIQKTLCPTEALGLVQSQSFVGNIDYTMIGANMRTAVIGADKHMPSSVWLYKQADHFVSI
jgi:hypothetical protein